MRIINGSIIAPKMTALLRIFFRVCLLRDGPQDLPAVGVLLGYCILVYFLTGILVAWPGREFVDAVLVSLVDTSLLMVFTAFLLAARSRTERWLQTTSALTGAGTIFNLIAIPIVLLINTQGLPDGTVSVVQSLLGYLIFFLLAWNVAVIGFIYRHALEFPFMAAMIIAFAYLGLSVYLINLLIIARV